MKRVNRWKDENVAFEPTRSYLIHTRFQQYLDVLLTELGVSPYRKMPNIFAELWGRYGSEDYRDVAIEFNYVVNYRRNPLPSLPLDS